MSDTAPGFAHQILDCAPHEVLEVLARLEITRSDLRTVQSLEPLAAIQPEERRAAHLVGRARGLAGRMRRALEVEG